MQNGVMNLGTSQEEFTRLFSIIEDTEMLFKLSYLPFGQIHTLVQLFGLSVNCSIQLFLFTLWHKSD